MREPWITDLLRKWRGKVSRITSEPSTPEFATGPSFGVLPLPSIPTTLDNELLIDFRLYELGQILQRLLPAEIASLHRNDVRQVFLNDVQLRAYRYVFQRHRHLYIAGQVGIIEFVCVAQAFVRNELNVFTTKRM